MSNFDRKAGPPGGPGDRAAAAAMPDGPPAYEADAGPTGGPGDFESMAEEAEEES